MKRVYVVSYDGDISDDDSVISEIKSGISWWQYLDNMWLMVTEDSLNDIWYRLENKINKEKRFLIVEVNMKNRQGWLKQEEWDWIKEYIDK